MAVNSQALINQRKSAFIGLVAPLRFARPSPWCRR